MERMVELMGLKSQRRMHTINKRMSMAKHRNMIKIASEISGDNDFTVLVFSSFISRMGAFSERVDMY